MAATDVLSRYSRAGFYHAPVSKALTGFSVLGFGCLQIPAMHKLHKYLVCKIPDSFLKGDFWRLLTAKIFFMDSRDLILSLILVYYFRIFERRLGSRRFASRLLSSMVLSTVVEVSVTAAVSEWARANDRVADFSGILAVGPFFMVFPWFAAFYSSVPPLSSAAGPFGNHGLGFPTFSTKSLVYFVGFNLVIPSTANLIAGLSGIISGVLLHYNALWVKDWIYVPGWLSNLCYKLVGRFIESGPPIQGMMGATLEIQRSQQMEAIEQQLYRQQARMAVAGMHRVAGGGGAAAAVPGRAPAGQGFAERLVDDQPGIGGIFPRMNRMGQDVPPAAPPAPSEDSIRMLIDMGFVRDRVVRALERTGNDVQAATLMLLQENDG